MKFTKQMQNAYVVTCYLQTHGKSSVMQMANALDLSYSSVMKIAQKMQRKGLLLSKPGHLGGYEMARRFITMYDLIHCFDDLKWNVEYASFTPFCTLRDEIYKCMKRQVI